MKKISLKNILKKTFKKKAKSKSKKSCKTKVRKSKKIKTIVKPKIKKTVVKKPSKSSAKFEAKVDNLRISKNNEIKPEIKKVKKQETEKREFKIKDYVVYPKHGVGQINEFKKINIGGIDVETYLLNLKKIKLMAWYQ